MQWNFIPNPAGGKNTRMQVPSPDPEVLITTSLIQLISKLTALW